MKLSNKKTTRNKNNRKIAINNKKKTDYSHTSTDEEWVCTEESFDDIEKDRSTTE